MPLKKLKLSGGQQNIGHESFTSQESIEPNSDTDCPCSESSSFVKLDAGSFSESESSSSRRGTTTSWRSFGESKWRDIYPQLLLKEDGHYYISVTKQLGISIQYLDNNSVVRTRNLKLLEIIHGTADVITEAVISYLASKAPVTLDISKLAGGATDGASVMVGCEHGVVTRIKQVVPTFIATHCSAHRLSLATCDTCNASTMIQRFQRILNQIYVFFSGSTHEAAEGEATAHGLCNEIVNPTFIASLLLLSNILAILGNLFRTFQLAQLNLLAVEQLVEDAKVALCVIKEDPLHGGYMMDLEATMKKLKLLLHLKKLALLRMPNHTLVSS
ncbi:Zinc finger protein [Oopsacas minuta]|uniref:Zinc finger protein n=1 Tax=Oopsacas minuta TaxID=111878 RepID=A0AAV7JT81_9METZ|nr:Zinc finger protein [Oopsacas minuta]